MTERLSGSWAASVAALALAVLAIAVVSACSKPGASAALDSNQSAGNDPVSAVVPESAIVIQRAPGAPRIDGEVDPIWNEVPARPIRVPVVGTPRGGADLAGDFRVLYDDRGLYLLFTVTDDSSRSDSPLPFEDDAVELYIDGGYERVNYYDRNDWQFVFGRDGSWWVTADQRDLHPDLELASVETETGYNIEVAVPWDGVGIQPVEGAAIGLEAHLDDDDDGDGVDAVLAWHAAGPSYEDASLMGAAVLGGAEAARDAGSAVAPAPSPTRGMADPLIRNTEIATPLPHGEDQEALNVLTERELEAGFELLFDGESLDRWRGFRSESVPGGWRADDGLLVFDPETGGGDLVSREAYADFELTLEWMISEGGNSGIFYRVTEEYEAPWETGPEMQVLDDERHSDGRVPEWSAGGTYGMHAPMAKVVRPAGEWNRVRILVDFDYVAYWLNGVKVVEYRLWSEEWEELVAATKFARMPGYGRARAGHIVLQDHDDPVRYRNVKIRRLSEPSSANANGLRLLAYHESAGHDHETDSAGVAALRDLGEEHGFEVDAADDSRVFTRDGLAAYDVVVFLNTTGDVLSDEEQMAFEAYIRDGGGFVGVHSATDTEYDWVWYGGLVGGYFAAHPGVQAARIYVTDTGHPSTRHLPAAWARTDEWYDFRDGPGDEVSVVMVLDESSYRGAKMGEPHPIAWYHEYDGGRAFYTGIGHRATAFSDPLYMRHLLGGVVWAAGRAAKPGDIGEGSDDE